MKKLIVIFTVLILNTVIVNSQDYWETINVPDNIKIMCMAANNQNHIFLGSGGNNISEGIYRSVDSCNSWEFLGFGNSSVYSMNINEYNHIYIGWIGNIYKSTDNGENWILKYDGMGNIICFDSYPGGIMFANSGTGTYVSIIRSLDYGETWDEVMIIQGMVEYVYDIAILNQDTICAGTTNWFDGGGVYRSVDGGDNWEHIGMYDFHVLALELNSQGDLFAGTYGNNSQFLSGVFVLYKGEEEWTQLCTTLVNDMKINSKDYLYAATDFGVLSSTDNGQTFEYINDGLFTGDVDDLALDSAGYLYASSYNVYMARSVNSTLPNPPIPSNYPENFSAHNIELEWTDPVSGVLPHANLVLMSDISFEAIDIPIDNVLVSDSDTAKNILYEVEKCIFTNLAPATVYYFKIFPYTINGDLINYKTEGGGIQAMKMTKE